MDKKQHSHQQASHSPKEKTHFPWIFLWREADTLHGGIWNLDGTWGLSEPLSITFVHRENGWPCILYLPKPESPQGNERMEKSLEAPPGLGSV